MRRNTANHAPIVDLLTREAWADLIECSPRDPRDIRLHSLALDGAGALGIAMDWTRAESGVARAGVFRLDENGALSQVVTFTDELLRTDLFRASSGSLWGAARGVVAGTLREVLFSFDDRSPCRYGRPLTADSIAMVGARSDRLVRLLTNRSHRRIARLVISPLVGEARVRSIKQPRHPYPTDCALDSAGGILVVGRLLHDAEIHRYDIDGHLQSMVSMPVGGPSAPITPSAMRLLDVDGESHARFIAAQGDALGILTTAPAGRPTWVELLRLPDPASIVHAIDRPRRGPNGGSSALFQFGGEEGRPLGNGWVAWSDEHIVASLISGPEPSPVYRDAQGNRFAVATEGLTLRLAETRDDGSTELVFAGDSGDFDILLMKVTTSA